VILIRDIELTEINKDLNEKLAQTFIQDVLCEDAERNQKLLSELVFQCPVLVYRYSSIFTQIVKIHKKLNTPCRANNLHTL
jgi:dephospho-CoA kinase